jgi:DNA-binding response OmpR family regulator
MSTQSSGGRTPAFGVRFESADDFLVAYSDHLRHGRVVLPLSEAAPLGAVVRVRLTLPDESVLFLMGRVRPPELAAIAGTWVSLDALDDEQREVLENCVTCMAVTDDPSGAGAEDARADVLLVDDAVSVRLTLGELLRRAGLRVRVAENGLVALSSALKRIPDVIVTDVEMPVMDGWKLLQTVRGRQRLERVPVVFLTQLGDDASRLRGYRLGVDDYLGKDMPPDEVVARVRAASARHHRVDRGAPGSGLRGALEQVRLGSVLAFLEAEHRSGQLRLCSEDGQEAVLHLQGGQLVGLDRLGVHTHVHDRVFELLSWVAGEFEFRAGADLPTPDDGTPISYLLLEHARRVDEDAAARH